MLWHKLLDTQQLGVKVRDVDRMIKHLVEAHDIHVFPVDTVNRGRPYDVIEHGIAVNRIVQELPYPEFFICLKNESILIDVLFRCNQLFKVRRGHWLIEIIALDIPNAEIHQVPALRFCLHALDNDRHGHRLGHVHHGFDDVHALSLVALVHAQEVGIELDDVHIQLPQHVQR